MGGHSPGQGPKAAVVQAVRTRDSSGTYICIGPMAKLHKDCTAGNGNGTIDMHMPPQLMTNLESCVDKRILNKKSS